MAIIGISPYVAHQGGWDEALFFGVPILLAVAAVWWLERRAKRNRDEE